MALVDKDHMTELRSASDAKATAATAEDEVQIKAVAFAINSASNAGQLSVEFSEVLRENTITQLESKGYTIKPAGIADPESIHLISWK